MNSRTTWMLALGAFALLAFILFVENPIREARARKVNRKIFPELRPDAITAIQVQPATQLDIRAERSNSVWHLVKPLSYPAEKKAIESLLQHLANCEWQTRIPAQELAKRKNAQEEFGFAQPQFSLVLQSGEDNADRLLVGAISALGDQVFLELVGDDNIYLADAELLKFLPRTRDDWRDSALMNLDSQSIEGIKIRSGGKGFELCRDPKTWLWSMQVPLKARATTEKIEDALAKLRDLRVKAFVSDNTIADLETFGLQASAQSLEIELSNRNSVVTLQLGGSPTNAPELVYARRMDRGNIVLAPWEPLRPWLSSYTNFLDLHLISNSREAIDSIEVRGEDDFTVARTADGEWIVKGRETFPADATLVSDWLSSLSTVDVEIEKTVVADFANYGLAKPQLEYIVRSASAAGVTNTLLAQIAFGMTNRDGPVFERRLDETSVNIVKREQFDRLPRASWQLRDRQIFNFASSNVVKITISQQGSTRKLMRDVEGDWTFAPGSIGTINRFSLEECLHRLGELRAVFWTGFGETDFDQFGFKETNHVVSLEVQEAGKTQVYSIEFGKPSPYLHPYASIIRNGKRWIFEFPAPLYYDFVRRDLTIPPAYRTRSK